MSKLANYEQYCNAFQGTETEQHLAGLLFLIRSHMLRIQDLDIAEAGFITTDNIINHYTETTGHPGDYISYPARKMARVFRHIVEHMRTNILHENVMMPIYKAKEFNSQSIGWLSRRPGRNIHEKLAGTRSVMAVHRRMTTDTSENRLFKTMARRLEDSLFIKKDKLPEVCQDEDEELLYGSLRRFRTLPEAEEILPWRNLPPNNTLLSDKNYNVVWRAWNDMENISQQISEDQENLDQRLTNIALILLIHKLGRHFRFPQQPIRYCYNTIDVEPVFQIIQALSANGVKKLTIEFVPETAKIILSYNNSRYELQFTNGQLKINGGKKQLSTEITFENFSKQLDNVVEQVLGIDSSMQVPVVHQEMLTGLSAVIDLFRFCPSILYNGMESRFPGQLLYQELQCGEKTYLLDCSESRAVLDFQAENVRPYTVRKLVADDEERGILYLKHLLDAAYCHVHTQQLDFIFPDSCNEFQLSHLKRVAKMYYRKVMAFPKSLAAIFTFVQDVRFQREFRANDVVLVLDRENDGTSVTLIRSTYNKNAQTAVPESRGIIWEHHPARFYPDNEEDGNDDNILQVIDRKDVIEADSYLSYWRPDGAWIQEKNIIPPAPPQRSLKKIIDDYKKKHRYLIGKNRIWIIAVADLQEPLSNIYLQVDYSQQSVLGGICHYQELRQRTEQPLWRDCLPDLAIKRLYGKLDLVKDSTFEYGEMLTMDIPVASGFTLPKGQEEYHFQLDMANAEAKVPYQAVVRHEVFPLENDVECRLQMRYIYGNDNPYSLKFIPLHKEDAGFNEAEVQWQRIDTYPYEHLQYPGFPSKHTWDYLQNYPNKKGAEPLNLLTGFIDGVRNLVRRWSHEKITNGSLEGTANWILMCLHNIYFNGRYIGDSECPSDIQNRLKSSLNTIYELFCNVESDSEDISWLFSMLCIAGRDVDESFIPYVIDYIWTYANNPRNFRREVGFMLGDFSLPYQQRIAQELNTSLPNDVIPLVLSKAAWRNERFIFNFPLQSTKFYFEQAVQDLIKDNRYPTQDLQLRLEFIMAVFRLRQLENEKINEYLSMNNPLMRKLYRKVEELIKRGFNRQSRIKLEVRQNVEYKRYHIPDFMYALLVYITGDAGDSDIVISSIEESNAN